jgi:hypothetical protein
LKFNQLQNFKFYTGGWVRHHKNSPAEIVADRLEAAEPSGRPSYAQPVEIVAAMPRVRFTRPRSHKSVPVSRTHRGSQSTTIHPQNCADKNGKGTVLRELRLLTQEQTSEFKILTRSHTPDSPPSSCEELTDIALKLRQRVDLGPQQRYRLVGVGLSNFREPEGTTAQPVLFE